jgi:hypothetical protein
MTTDDVVDIIASNSAEHLGSTGPERPHARRANSSVGSCDVGADLLIGGQPAGRGASRFSSAWCGSPGMQRARGLQRASSNAIAGDGGPR